jgi:hypothetical protein
VANAEAWHPVHLAFAHTVAERIKRFDLRIWNAQRLQERGKLSSTRRRKAGFAHPDFAQTGQAR